MSARGRFRVSRRRRTRDSRGGPRPRAPRSVRVRLRVFESAARSIGARRRRPPPRRGRSAARGVHERDVVVVRGCAGVRGVEIVPRGIFRVEGGARPLEDVHASARTRREHGSGPRIGWSRPSWRRCARAQRRVSSGALGDGLDGAVVAGRLFSSAQTRARGREDARGGAARRRRRGRSGPPRERERDTTCSRERRRAPPRVQAAPARDSGRCRGATKSTRRLSAAGRDPTSDRRASARVARCVAVWRQTRVCAGAVTRQRRATTC